MLRNTLKRFGSITKLLHWLVFIMIVAQFYLIWYRDVLPNGSPEKALYLMLHKSVGINILILGILFIIWHIINTKPQPPEFQPGWQRMAAKIVHYSLFILLIIMPIVGFLLSCASGYPVNYFNLLTISCPIAGNDPLGDILFSAHQKIAYLILILLGIHILAALYHHSISKDNVLKRMLPFTSSKDEHIE